MTVQSCQLALPIGLDHKVWYSVYLNDIVSELLCGGLEQHLRKHASIIIQSHEDMNNTEYVKHKTQTVLQKVSFYLTLFIGLHC